MTTQELPHPILVADDDADDRLMTLDDYWLALVEIPTDSADDHGGQRHATHG